MAAFLPARDWSATERSPATTGMFLTVVDVDLDVEEAAAVEGLFEPCRAFCLEEPTEWAHLVPSTAARAAASLVSRAALLLLAPEPPPLFNVLGFALMVKHLGMCRSAAF